MEHRYRRNALIILNPQTHVASRGSAKWVDLAGKEADPRKVLADLPSAKALFDRCAFVVTLNTPNNSAFSSSAPLETLRLLVDGVSQEDLETVRFVDDVAVIGTEGASVLLDDEDDEDSHIALSGPTASGSRAKLAATTSLPHVAGASSNAAGPVPATPAPASAARQQQHAPPLPTNRSPPLICERDYVFTRLVDSYKTNASSSSSSSNSNSTGFYSSSSSSSSGPLGSGGDHHCFSVLAERLGPRAAAAGSNRDGLPAAEIVYLCGFDVSGSDFATCARQLSQHSGSSIAIVLLADYSLVSTEGFAYSNGGGIDGAGGASGGGVAGCGFAVSSRLRSTLESIGVPILPLARERQRQRIQGQGSAGAYRHHHHHQYNQQHGVAGGGAPPFSHAVSAFRTGAADLKSSFAAASAAAENNKNNVESSKEESSRLLALSPVEHLIRAVKRSAEWSNEPAFLLFAKLTAGNGKGTLSRHLEGLLRYQLKKDRRKRRQLRTLAKEGLLSHGAAMAAFAAMGPQAEERGETDKVLSALLRHSDYDGLQLLHLACAAGEAEVIRRVALPFTGHGHSTGRGAVAGSHGGGSSDDHDDEGTWCEEQRANQLVRELIRADRFGNTPLTYLCAAARARFTSPFSGEQGIVARELAHRQKLASSVFFMGGGGGTNGGSGRQQQAGPKRVSSWALQPLYFRSRPLGGELVAATAAGYTLAVNPRSPSLALAVYAAATEAFRDLVEPHPGAYQAFLEGLVGFVLPFQPLPTPPLLPHFFVGRMVASPSGGHHAHYSGAGAASSGSDEDDDDGDDDSEAEESGGEDETDEFSDHRQQHNSSMASLALSLSTPAPGQAKAGAGHLQRPSLAALGAIPLSSPTAGNHHHHHQQQLRTKTIVGVPGAAVGHKESPLKPQQQGGASSSSSSSSTPVKGQADATQHPAASPFSSPPPSSSSSLFGDRAMVASLLKAAAGSDRAPWYPLVHAARSGLFPLVLALFLNGVDDLGMRQAFAHLAAAAAARPPAMMMIPRAPQQQQQQQQQQRRRGSVESPAPLLATASSVATIVPAGSAEQPQPPPSSSLSSSSSDPSVELQRAQRQLQLVYQHHAAVLLQANPMFLMTRLKKALMRPFKGGCTLLQLAVWCGQTAAASILLEPEEDMREKALDGLREVEEDREKMRAARASASSGSPSESSAMAVAAAAPVGSEERNRSRSMSRSNGRKKGANGPLCGLTRLTASALGGSGISKRRLILDAQRMLFSLHATFTPRHAWLPGRLSEKTLSIFSSSAGDANNKGHSSHHQHNSHHHHHQESSAGDKSSSSSSSLASATLSLLDIAALAGHTMTSRLLVRMDIAAVYGLAVAAKSGGGAGTGGLGGGAAGAGGGSNGVGVATCQLSLQRLLHRFILLGDVEAVQKTLSLHTRGGGVSVDRSLLEFTSSLPDVNRCTFVGTQWASPIPQFLGVCSVCSRKVCLVCVDYCSDLCPQPHRPHSSSASSSSSSSSSSSGAPVAKCVRHTIGSFVWSNRGVCQCHGIHLPGPSVLNDPRAKEQRDAIEKTLLWVPKPACLSAETLDILDDLKGLSPPSPAPSSGGGGFHSWPVLAGSGGGNSNRNINVKRATTSTIVAKGRLRPVMWPFAPPERCDRLAEPTINTASVPSAAKAVVTRRGRRGVGAWASAKSIDSAAREDEEDEEEDDNEGEDDSSSNSENDGSDEGSTDDNDDDDVGDTTGGVVSFQTSSKKLEGEQEEGDGGKGAAQALSAVGPVAVPGTAVRSRSAMRRRSSEDNNDKKAGSGPPSVATTTGATSIATSRVSFALPEGDESSSPEKSLGSPGRRPPGPPVTSRADVAATATTAASHRPSPPPRQNSTGEGNGNGNNNNTTDGLTNFTPLSDAHYHSVSGFFSSSSASSSSSQAPSTATASASASSTSISAPAPALALDLASSVSSQQPPPPLATTSMTMTTPATAYAAQHQHQHPHKPKEADKEEEGWKGVVGPTYAPVLAEELARLFHVEWSRLTASQGWRWGPTSDHKAFVNSNLKPWCKLTDLVKQENRLFGAGILRLLFLHAPALGFELGDPRHLPEAVRNHIKEATRMHARAFGIDAEDDNEDDEDEDEDEGNAEEDNAEEDGEAAEGNGGGGGGGGALKLQSLGSLFGSPSASSASAPVSRQPSQETDDSSDSRSNLIGINSIGSNENADSGSGNGDGGDGGGTSNSDTNRSNEEEARAAGDGDGGEETPSGHTVPVPSVPRSVSLQRDTAAAPLPMPQQPPRMNAHTSFFTATATTNNYNQAGGAKKKAGRGSGASASSSYSSSSFVVPNDNSGGNNNSSRNNKRVSVTGPPPPLLLSTSSSITVTQVLSTGDLTTTASSSLYGVGITNSRGSDSRGGKGTGRATTNNNNNKSKVVVMRRSITTPLPTPATLQDPSLGAFVNLRALRERQLIADMAQFHHEAYCLARMFKGFRWSSEHSPVDATNSWMLPFESLVSSRRRLYLDTAMAVVAFLSSPKVGLLHYSGVVRGTRKVKASIVPHALQGLVSPAAPAFSAAGLVAGSTALSGGGSSGHGGLGSHGTDMLNRPPIFAEAEQAQEEETGTRGRAAARINPLNPPPLLAMAEETSSPSPLAAAAAAAAAVRPSSHALPFAAPPLASQKGAAGEDRDRHRALVRGTSLPSQTAVFSAEGQNALNGSIHARSALVDDYKRVIRQAFHRAAVMSRDEASGVALLELLQSGGGGGGGGSGVGGNALSPRGESSKNRRDVARATSSNNSNNSNNSQQQQQQKKPRASLSPSKQQQQQQQQQQSQQGEEQQGEEEDNDQKVTSFASSAPQGPFPFPSSAGPGGGAIISSSAHLVLTALQQSAFLGRERMVRFLVLGSGSAAGLLTHRDRYGLLVKDYGALGGHTAILRLLEQCTAAALSVAGADGLSEGDLGGAGGNADLSSLLSQSAALGEQGGATAGTTYYSKSLSALTSLLLLNSSSSSSSAAASSRIRSSSGGTGSSSSSSSSSSGASNKASGVLSRVLAMDRTLEQFCLFAAGVGTFGEPSMPSDAQLSLLLAQREDDEEGAALGFNKGASALATALVSSASTIVAASSKGVDLLTFGKGLKHLRVNQLDGDVISALQKSHMAQAFFADTLTFCVIGRQPLCASDLVALHTQAATKKDGTGVDPYTRALLLHGLARQTVLELRRRKHTEARRESHDGSSRRRSRRGLRGADTSLRGLLSTAWSYVSDGVDYLVFLVRAASKSSSSSVISSGTSSDGSYRGSDDGDGDYICAAAIECADELVRLLSRLASEELKDLVAGSSLLDDDSAALPTGAAVAEGIADGVVYQQQQYTIQPYYLAHAHAQQQQQQQQQQQAEEGSDVEEQGSRSAVLKRAAASVFVPPSASTPIPRGAVRGSVTMVTTTTTTASSTAPAPTPGAPLLSLGSPLTTSSSVARPPNPNNNNNNRSAIMAANFARSKLGVASRRLNLPPPTPGGFVVGGGASAAGAAAAAAAIGLGLPMSPPLSAASKPSALSPATAAPAIQTSGSFYRSSSAAAAASSEGSIKASAAPSSSSSSAPVSTTVATIAPGLLPPVLGTDGSVKASNNAASDPSQAAFDPYSGLQEADAAAFVNGAAGGGDGDGSGSGGMPADGSNVFLVSEAARLAKMEERTTYRVLLAMHKSISVQRSRVWHSCKALLWPVLFVVMVGIWLFTSPSAPNLGSGDEVGVATQLTGAFSLAFTQSVSDSSSFFSFLDKQLNFIPDFNITTQRPLSFDGSYLSDTGTPWNPLVNNPPASSRRRRLQNEGSGGEAESSFAKADASRHAAGSSGAQSQQNNADASKPHLRFSTLPRERVLQYIRRAEEQYAQTRTFWGVDGNTEEAKAAAARKLSTGNIDTAPVFFTSINAPILIHPAASTSIVEGDSSTVTTIFSLYNFSSGIYEAGQVYEDSPASPGSAAAPANSTDGQMVLGQAVVLGAIRVRAIQYPYSTCSSFGNLPTSAPGAGPCVNRGMYAGPSVDYGRLDDQPIIPQSDLYSQPSVGQFVDLDSGDLFLRRATTDQIRPPSFNPLPSLANANAGASPDFLTQNTRSLIIDFTLYLPSMAMLACVRLYSYQVQTGPDVNTIIVRTMRSPNAAYAPPAAFIALTCVQLLVHVVAFCRYAARYLFPRCFDSFRIRFMAAVTGWSSSLSAACTRDCCRCRSGSGDGSDCCYFGRVLCCCEREGRRRGRGRRGGGGGGGRVITIGGSNPSASSSSSSSSSSTDFLTSRAPGSSLWSSFLSSIRNIAYASLEIDSGGLMGLLFESVYACLLLAVLIQEARLLTMLGALNLSVSASDTFYDFWSILDCWQSVRDLTATIVFVASIRFLRVLGVLPFVGPVLTALRRTIFSANVLMNVGIVLAIIFIVSVAHSIAFSSDSYNFSILRQSFLSCFTILYANETDNYHAVYPRITSTIFFMLWLVLSGLLFNLLIATVSSAYDDTVKRSKDDWEASLTKMMETMLLQRLETESRVILATRKGHHNGKKRRQGQGPGLIGGGSNNRNSDFDDDDIPLGFDDGDDSSDDDDGAPRYQRRRVSHNPGDSGGVRSASSSGASAAVAATAAAASAEDPRARALRELEEDIKASDPPHVRKAKLVEFFRALMDEKVRRLTIALARNHQRKEIQAATALAITLARRRAAVTAATGGAAAVASLPPVNICLPSAMLRRPEDVWSALRSELVRQWRSFETTAPSPSSSSSGSANSNAADDDGSDDDGFNGNNDNK